MAEIKYYNEGIYKVVNASDVEQYTSTGWRLVEIIQTTEVVGTRTDVFSVPNYTGGPMEASYQVNPMIGAVTQFVLIADKESALAKMKAELDGLTRVLAEAQGAGRDLSKSNERLNAELERYRQMAERRTEEMDELRSERDMLNTKKRKMEMDLGKLRTEIGEAEIRRILGSETKS